MPKELVKIENLSKNYGQIEAVKNISLTIKEGEIVALLGPNGAGKSTLMNMIAGYLSPSSGEISICGKNIKDCPLWGKEHIGFLPEGAPLYADLTVKQFLDYMSELRGVDREKTNQAIKLANIEEVLNQKVETLSKGYQRRVGFAQSVLADLPILMLDEPTDGLDPNQKKHMRGLVSKMGKNKAIIISTHLLEEAEDVCSRIVLMKHGRVVADGTLKSILSKYKSKSLEEVFFKLAGDEGEQS